MNKLPLKLAGIFCAGSALLSSCTQIDTAPTAAEMQPSYVAMETNSGRILYAANPNEKRPVGMLANIATALVALDWINARGINLDTQLTVPAAACQWPATNLLHLRPGDRISLRDALHSTIMWDDSACATTIAVACGSTLSATDPEGAFIAQMNQLARTIGMTATRFKGSNGSVISYASARDMALLGMYAIEKPSFEAICSTRSYQATISSAAGTRQAQITNSNSLLANGTVDGVRAARSISAGACVVATAKRASVKRTNPLTGQPATYAQRLLVVVMGMPTGQQRYKVASDLLRDGWGAWESWQATSDLSDSSKFIILPK